MMNIITGIAYGLVVFSILVGVGLVVLHSFGSSIAACSADKTFNVTSGTAYCSNATASVQVSATGAAQQVTTVSGYVGASSGGLVTWVPAIIALVIGVAFIAMFMGKNQNKA